VDILKADALSIENGVIRPEKITPERHDPIILGLEHLVVERGHKLPHEAVEDEPDSDDDQDDAPTDAGLAVVTNRSPHPRRPAAQTPGSLRRFGGRVLGELTKKADGV
jgi:hypothetical protein